MKFISIIIFMAIANIIVAQTQLSHFDVSYKYDKTVIRWSVEKDIEVKGWNIYRSTNRCGLQNSDAVKLNRTGFILASQNNDALLTYKFKSTQVKGFSYWYWLESVTFGGETHIYGPISSYIPAYSENCLKLTPKAPILSDIKSNNKTSKKWRML